MTKTEQKPAAKRRGDRRPGWAVAALLVVLTVAGILLTLSGGSGEVADNPATTTTQATEAEAMTDLEVIEAGVEAFYSGDAERAAELFELSDRTDDEIRAEAAYQAAIGGRLELNCDEGSLPGRYVCRTPYHNELTDALNRTDSPGDTNTVVVDDGVITMFGFPEHSYIVIPIGARLAMEGRFDGYEECAFGPFPESCAALQLRGVDGLLEWQRSLDPVSVVQFALESWYGGDCEEALFASILDAEPCAGADTRTQTMEYESALQAEVSVDNCTQTSRSMDTLDERLLSCEVRYSNAMSRAVGREPAVTVREFSVFADFGVLVPEEEGWYAHIYPEDSELRESFRRFAEGGELADEYATAGCATARTPECAALIVDNLDEWAAWYEANR